MRPERSTRHQAFEAALKVEGFHYPAMAHLASARFLRDELPEAEQLAASLREHFRGMQ